MLTNLLYMIKPSHSFINYNLITSCTLLNHFISFSLFILVYIPNLFVTLSFLLQQKKTRSNRKLTEQEKKTAAHRHIALAKNSDDLEPRFDRLPQTLHLLPPMRFIRRQQLPPVLIPSFPIQNLKKPRKPLKPIKKKTHKQIKLGQIKGSAHGDDGVGEGDVGEEEGEPAGEGGEAGVGPAVADGVDVEEKDSAMFARRVFDGMAMRGESGVWRKRGVC